MGTYRKIKKTIFDIIQPAKRGNLASKLFDVFIMLLVFASIASVFILTFDVSARVIKYLYYIEQVALTVFSIEYLLRIWTADMLYPQLSPWRARGKYVLSGMAIIDLVSILPFYIPMFFTIDVEVIRALLLMLLLRLFKLSRYTDAVSAIWSVFRNKIQEMLVSVVFVVMILIVASLLIYYAEHDAQPEQFSNAFSGLWWAVATLTTVGYGDIYPITPLGRVLGAIIAILGIGMVAVPTSILSAGFMETLEKHSSPQKDAESAASDPCPHKNEGADDSFEPPQYCPHCGKKLFP